MIVPCLCSEYLSLYVTWIKEACKYFKVVCSDIKLKRHLTKLYQKHQPLHVLLHCCFLKTPCSVSTVISVTPTEVHSIYLHDSKDQKSVSNSLLSATVRSFSDGRLYKTPNVEISQPVRSNDTRLGEFKYFTQMY